MKEYIEREALIDEIDGTTWYHISCQKILVEGAACEADALYKATDIYNVIKSAPTADVVEVVRCCDCEHYNMSSIPNGFGWCEYYNTGAIDEHYCSHGERKGN